MKKILILNAHPSEKSFCNGLANKYYEGAKEAGHDVKMVNIKDLNFDLILHGGFAEITELEPDLIKQQENIKWCEHLVIITPLWWGGLPANLKGFIDRTLLPNFAFKYKQNGSWDKLLTGRTARVIYTQGAPFWYSLIASGDPFWNMLKKGTLEFCGFKPVKRTTFDLIQTSTPEKREKWLQKVYDLGLKGY